MLLSLIFRITLRKILITTYSDIMWCTTNECVAISYLYYVPLDQQNAYISNSDQQNAYISNSTFPGIPPVWPVLRHEVDTRTHWQPLCLTWFCHQPRPREMTHTEHVTLSPWLLTQINKRPTGLGAQLPIIWFKVKNVKGSCDLGWGQLDFDFC